VRTSEHKAGAQLLVVSRIGFLKATKVCPAVAVKLLWNLATALSWKFTLRNQRLRELGATIEAQRRKSARQEETAQLKDAAAKLDTLVRGSKAVYSLRASSKWHETMSAPPPSSAAAPSRAADELEQAAPSSTATPAGPLQSTTRPPIRASPSWEAAFSEGLSTFARLETRVLETRVRAGSLAASKHASKGLKGSVSTTTLPSESGPGSDQLARGLRRGSAKSQSGSSLPVVKEGL
jgi:hypothetical protein